MVALFSSSSFLDSSGCPFMAKRRSQLLWSLVMGSKACFNPILLLQPQYPSLPIPFQHEPVVPPIYPRGVTELLPECPPIQPDPSLNKPILSHSFPLVLQSPLQQHPGLLRGKLAKEDYGKNHH